MDNNMKGVFVQSLNPMTGKSEWKMQPEDYDYQQEVARAAFADMLHDAERNHLYYVGLAAAIKKKRSEGQEVRVLDIGTGTGLLSMMAVKIGADSITACEEFRPIANIAERVIASNGFSDQIKLIRKRSTEITVGPGKDMERRANILVTEVFDTELIGEGAIGTFNHAHKELLTEDCLVVPCEGTMYAQVVESDLASRWNQLHPIHGLIPPLDEEVGSSSALSLHDVQLSQIKTEWFKPVTPPLPVFKFDFSGRNGPIPINEQTVTSATALISGRCDAVFIWWDVFMDPERKVLLSCAPIWAHPNPDNIAWRDHWMQAIYYPMKTIYVQEGQNVSIVSDHNEYSLLFDVSKKDPKLITQIPASIPFGGIHQAGISRTRLGQINDEKRNDIFISALLSTFAACKSSRIVCLCISEQSLLPLLAVVNGASKVYVSEQNRHMKTILQGYIRQNNILQGDKIVFLEKELASLTPEDIPEKIDVVIGEPHFTICYLPWHNLFFWYCLRQCIHNVSECQILPKRAELWALPVDFKDLWKIRSPLHEVEGFKMKHFDDIIMSACDVSDASVEPHPLWEYPCKARAASPTRLMSFDLRDSIPTELVSTDLKIEATGFVNGMVLWVDWYLTDKDVVSGGPVKRIPHLGEDITWDIHSQQGVYFFKNISSPKSSRSIISCKTTFNPQEGDIDFSFSKNEFF